MAKQTPEQLLLDCMNNKYAKVSWSLSDLMDHYNLRPTEAKAFMEKNAKVLQSAMIVCGWEVLDQLTAQAGIEKYED